MPRAQRTFGWIQDSGKLENLKRISGLFVKESLIYKELLTKRLPLIWENNKISKKNLDFFLNYLKADKIVIPYSILKGKGCEQERKDAECSGIAQAVLDAQKSVKWKDLKGIKRSIKKPYQSDWATESFIRWAISTGIIEYDSATDTCCVTKIGIDLANSAAGSEKEKEIFKKALLKYPPVHRILQLLSEAHENGAYTKFELGSKLGFIGELGFTSIPQGYFMSLLETANTIAEKNKIRNNVEGDSDKYARMIAGWLIKVGWIEKCKKEVAEAYRGHTLENKLQAYRITVQGLRDFHNAQGNSRHPRLEKIVLYQMLATKASDADYLRKRRGLILTAIKHQKSISSILDFLKAHNIDENKDAILDDINGFENIGLCISETMNNKYILKDHIIGLEIPQEETKKEDITKLKDTVRTKLTLVDHSYLVLIDLAYSDAATKSKKNEDARDFELKTAELLTKEIQFKGERLGDSDKPDVVVWEGEETKYGIIIDNKSYKDGFSIGRKCEDEMSRYIEQAQQKKPGQPSNEWWKILVDNNVNETGYLFVTSYLKGSYKDSLTSLSTRRQINGGAISIENLLYLVEKIKRGSLEVDNVRTMFNNDEIKISL